MAGMVLDKDDVAKLQARLNRVCDECHELGASTVLIMCSFEDKDEDGTLGNNRAYRRDGNFYETLGLLESVRASMLADAAPKDQR